VFDAAVEKRTGLIGNFLQADGTDDFIHFHRFYSMTLLMFFTEEGGGGDVEDDLKVRLFGFEVI